MAYIFYSIITACIYIYLGLGLTILFCPKVLKKYVLVLSPIVGYSYLTLAGWYCYNLNLGGTDIYAKYILVLPTFFLFFILLKNLKKLSSLKHLLSDKELLTVLLTACLGFIVISLPLIVNYSSLTSISLGNNDPANYALISRYLKEFSRSDHSGYFGQAITPAPFQLDWQIESTVFGAFLCTSFTASLLSLEVYQVQSMTIHIFFAFGIAITYIIARQIFEYKRWAAFAVGILYAVNPIMYYTVYQGFQSQIIAISSSLCIFLLNIQAIFSCRRYQDWYSYIPLSILFNWGLSITYPHMLPIVYGPIIIYLICYSIYKRSLNLIFQYVLFVAVTILLMSLLSLSRLTALISYFSLMGRTEAGWYIPLIGPDRIFTGIHHGNHASIFQSFLGLVLSAIIIGCVACGFIKSCKTNYKLSILAGSSVSTIYGGYIILSVINLITTHQLGGYKGYKLLSFFLPQILVGSLMFFIIGCLEAFKHIKLTRKIRNQASILSLLFLLQILNTSSLTVQALRDGSSVTSDLIDLRKVEGNNSIHSINMLGHEKDWWRIRWQVYFLAKKKLYLQTDLYSPTSNFNGEYNLLDLKEGSFAEVKSFPSTIVINSRYKIWKRTADTIATANVGVKRFDQEVKLLEQLQFGQVGKTIEIPVSVKNTSNFFWDSRGPSPVNFSYNWYDSTGSKVVWDGERTALPKGLAPQESVQLNPIVKLPDHPGNYILTLTMVQEGVAWFNDVGAEAPKIPVTVTPQ